MKKIIFILGCLWLLPKASFSTQTIPSPGLFNDSQAITVARSFKLGRIESSDISGAKPPVTPDKEKYDCVKNTDCTGGYICKNNKCADPCSTLSCNAGTKCSSGACNTCSYGATDCGCPSGKFANGSGSCVCTQTLSCPNAQWYNTSSCSCSPCPSREKCGCPGVGFSNGSGSCTSDPFTCPPGQKQNMSSFSCNICSRGESCSCPSGQLANGSGGCYTVDPCAGVSCAAGQQCSGGSCAACSYGSACGCPSGKISNGSGACTCPSGTVDSGSSCVTPACYNQSNCGSGQECMSGGSASAYCKNCGQGSSGSFCNCPSGQVATGSGGCKVNAACTTQNDCGSGQECMNGGTTSAYCKNCGQGSYGGYCNCPSGQVATGSGGCKVKAACTTQDDCSVGQECVSGGSASAYCKTCGSGSSTRPFCKQGSSSGGSGGKPWDYGYPCSSSSQCSTRLCAPSYNSSGQWIPQGSTCR